MKCLKDDVLIEGTFPAHYKAYLIITVRDEYHKAMKSAWRLVSRTRTEFTGGCGGGGEKE